MTDNDRVDDVAQLAAKSSPRLGDDNSLAPFGSGLAGGSRDRLQHRAIDNRNDGRVDCMMTVVETVFLLIAAGEVVVRQQIIQPELATYHLGQAPWRNPDMAAVFAAIWIERTEIFSREAR